MAKKKDKLPKFNPDDILDFDTDGFDEDDYIDYDMDFDSYDSSSYWEEPDFLLADIVHMMVNLAGLEIGVTLFVKGMTLTGILTSEKNYLKDLSETFRKRVHLKDKKMTKKERKEFDEMFDFTRLGESALAQEFDKEGIAIPMGTPPIRFLHLKNPLLVGSSGVMDFTQGDTPYIRLRLNLVDGWMLGELVTPDMFRDDSDQMLH